MANEVTTKRAAETIKGYLTKNKAAIAAAMPTGANYERFCRTVVNAISTTPSLAECTTESLFLSCVKAFSVGIEPNGPTQEGFLVPFKMKGVAKAQFMPSYRGLIALARRSGMVSLIYADSIKANDKYKISRGTDPKLEHEPAIKNRGDTLAYYAVARMSDGCMDFESMTPEEVIDISGRSNAVKAKNAGYIKETPWDTDFDEMAKKTVLKRLTKRLPVSVENLAFAKAVQADNLAENGDMENVIDVEGIEIPERIEDSEDPKRGRPRSKSEGKQMAFPPQEGQAVDQPASTAAPDTEAVLQPTADGKYAITDDTPPDAPVSEAEKAKVIQGMLGAGKPSMTAVREHLFGLHGYQGGLTQMTHKDVPELLEWIKNWKAGAEQ